MPVKWITVASGIRCYEHPTRRLKNGRADRYFAIRHNVGGKRCEEGLGWASEGWSADKAQGMLAKLKEATRTGSGPQTVAELREANQQRRKAESSEADTMTVAAFFDDYYMPVAKKRKRTWSHDVGRFEKGIRGRLGDIPFRGITKEHMEGLMDALRRRGWPKPRCCNTWPSCGSFSVWRGSR